MKIKRREKKKEIKRRKTRKVVLMKKCWMCDYFKNAERVSNDQRICTATRTRVMSSEKGCENLLTTTAFYCHKRHCYVSTRACIAIRQKKRLGNGNSWLSPEQYRKIYSECYEKCPQGRAVEWAVHNCGLAVEAEPETPVVLPKVKRRVTEPVVKIKRRTKIIKIKRRGGD